MIKHEILLWLKGIIYNVTITQDKTVTERQTLLISTRTKNYQNEQADAPEA